MGDAVTSKTPGGHTRYLATVGTDAFGGLAERASHGSAASTAHKLPLRSAPDNVRQVECWFSQINNLGG